MLWRVGMLPLRNRADKGTRDGIASIHPSVHRVARSGGVVPGLEGELRSLEVVCHTGSGLDQASCESLRSDKGGRALPLFMDYHDELKLPAEAIQQIAEEAKAQKSDQFGVRQAELFHNADGKVYCLLEAPNADAVRQHHAALGVGCGEVHEVRGIL